MTIFKISTLINVVCLLNQFVVNIISTVKYLNHTRCGFYMFIYAGEKFYVSICDS